MAHKRTRPGGNFKATDNDGNKVEIFITINEEEVAGENDNGPTWVKVGQKLATASGMHVKYVSQGKYQELSSYGARDLTSSDPAAP